jgi:hypothetical protein
MEERILENFKNHKAKRVIDGNLEHLIWSSGSSMYHIEYIFSGRTMFIKGDCGVAVFEFSQNVTAEKVVEYNDWNYYVMSKYSCSDFDKEDIDEEKFQKELDDWACDRTYKEKNAIWKAFKESYSVENYKQLIALEMYNGVLDCEDDEIYGFGRKKSGHFDVIFKGLELAVAQLKNQS